jgi:hypothetical protein
MKTSLEDLARRSNLIKHDENSHRAVRGRRSWFEIQKQGNVAGLIFDRKYPRSSRATKPTPSEIAQLETGQTSSSTTSAEMASEVVAPVHIVGNVVPPPLPAESPEVWAELWRPGGSDDDELLVYPPTLGDHRAIINQILDLLKSAIPFAVDKEGKDLNYRFRCEGEYAFKTSELKDFLLRAPKLKLRGVVDGAIRVLNRDTRDFANRPCVLIFEVKPAAVKPTGAKNKSGAEVEYFVSAAIAKEADEQIRHRANSVSLNPASPTLILLSVIGCSIRPYLWMGGQIRPSNIEVTIHESRVSEGPSPSLWVDLRGDHGKRLFQQVLLDVVRILGGRGPLDPNMYGAVGLGASQAKVVDSESSGSGPDPTSSESSSSRDWQSNVSSSPEKRPRGR